MSRAKYSHYAVRIGRVPGIYMTWEECDEEVHGYPFASFKGFKSLEEALQWMNKELPTTTRGKNAAKSAEKLSPEFYSKIGASGSHAYEIPIHSTPFTSSSAHVPKGGNTKGKAVVETEPAPETDGSIIIEEQMELYLLRVYAKLHYGCPRLERHVYVSQEGEQHYRFMGTLVCPEEGINLEAGGCFSPDEDEAREDAAYTLLDLLLTRKGHSISDFNYRRMCVLQQQVEDLQGSQGNQLARRLREKEAECAMLTKQIQDFHRYLHMY